MLDRGAPGCLVAPHPLSLLLVGFARSCLHAFGGETSRRPPQGSWPSRRLARRLLRLHRLERLQLPHGLAHHASIDQIARGI